MPVADLDDIKTFLRTTLTGVEDSVLTSSLAAAIELVNDDLKRNFTVAGAASARSCPPDSSSILRIHDCASITSVVDNGTVLVAGVDYQAEPIGNRGSAGDYRPFERLRRANDQDWSNSSGFATVVVTAAWGWATIPARVVEAVKVLTKDIVNHREIKFGVMVTDMGGVRTRQAALINDLTRHLARAKEGIG